jgi:hypothetical protein
MKRVLPLAALALFSAACGGGDGGSEAKVATTVTVTPGSVNFDAVGATQVVHAAVKDQKGRAMTGVAVSWSSSAAAVAVASLGGDSAMVTSAANGNASVTASAGTASGAAAALVAQVATTLQKVGGDQQQAAPGTTLGAQLRVKVLDRLGAPVVGQAVIFTVTAGGGTLSSTSVATGADGTAGTSWTLGSTEGAPQTVSASISGVATPLVFNATATAIVPPGSVALSAGDNQGAMAGTALPTRPAVLVKDASGNPAPGKTVTFAVTGGGGSLTGAVVTTDANGIAAVGSWTLGAQGGPNTLTATVSGGTFANNPVSFRAIGCEGGSGSGYAITLCFTTDMTASQRAVFESAANRWSSLISGDLEDTEAQIPAGSCGETTPSLDLTIDDLVIFASVEEIDGPNNILGSAGPCFIRTGGLPVIGVMRFDLADVNVLESAGQLGLVFLHEMGHVIGVGSLWSSRGLLHNPVSGNGSAVTDTYFSGLNGIAGFDAIGGATYTGGQKVPVENTGGPGTQNAHWRENVLKNELMTGYLNNGSNPLSAVTVRSLQDLGYAVNPGAADAFSLTLALRGSITGTQGGLKLENDVYTGPRWSIDRRGRKTLLNP